MPQFRDLGVLRALEELGLVQRAKATLRGLGSGFEVPLDAPIRELPTLRTPQGPVEYPSVLERNPLDWRLPSLRKLWNREI